MSSLIRRADAYRVLTEYYHHRTEGQHEALREALERVRGVDAIEAVRCKDCKHRHKVNAYQWCDIDPERDVEVDDEHYCSYGERKESE